MGLNSSRLRDLLCNDEIFPQYTSGVAGT